MTKKTVARDKSPVAAASATALRVPRKLPARPGAPGTILPTTVLSTKIRSTEGPDGAEGAAVDAHAKAKVKLVRDSFTIPKHEYAVLEALKARSVALARPAKKSELIRAGIAALQAMSDRRLLQALDAVPSLKTGRPKRVEPDAAR